MRKSIIIFAGCLLFLAVSSAAMRAQIGVPVVRAEDAADSCRQFTAEVQKLRVELVQQKIEFQEWKIKQFEREIQQAQVEQQRLAHEDQSLQQRLLELAQEINASQQREQIKDLEAMKTELRENDLSKLQARLLPLNQRVADLAEQLKQAVSERNKLSQQDERLKAAIPKS
jgi:chromosome segregation ATPase